jgi:hypothetical protein
MESINSFITYVQFERTVWAYIPEDGTLHNYSLENLNFWTFFRKFRGKLRVILQWKFAQQEKIREVSTSIFGAYHQLSNCRSSAQYLH